MRSEWAEELREKSKKVMTINLFMELLNYIVRNGFLEINLRQGLISDILIPNDK